MKNTSRWFAALSLTVLLGGMARAWFTEPQVKSPLIHEFMRTKLEFSKNVLEGLATSNFELLGQNARKLRELTEQEQWRVNPDMTYIRYSNEFQELATKLEANAKRKNLDGATLDYINLTINCVNCHKFVRGEKITLRDQLRVIR